jgi:type II secretory pathway pseudopilin PulG
MTKIVWTRNRRGTRNGGFTMIETLLTMGVMTVVGSMAAFQIGQSQPALKSDGAMRVVMGQLNTARELSITQRRNMQVNFVGTSAVQIVREDVPNGTTTISTVPFEGGAQFGTVADLPDTPDGFGNQSAVAFGAAAAVRFSSNGTLIDQTGKPINGTVFVNVASFKSSGRAVTILGATGRIRAYRWDGAKWALV